MSKTIFLIFLLNTTLLPLDLSNIQDLTNWEKIQDEPVKIEWTKHKGFPISRSEIILGHPIDKVFNTIQSLESYPEIFHRVEKAIRLDTNIVQIMLDMPFPFSGRDYVIRYETKRQKHQYTLLFWSVNHKDEIKSDDKGEYVMHDTDTIRPADGKNFKKFIKGKQSGKMDSGYLSDDDYTVKDGKIVNK